MRLQIEQIQTVGIVIVGATLEEHSCDDLQIIIDLVASLYGRRAGTPKMLWYRKEDDPLSRDWYKDFGFKWPELSASISMTRELLDELYYTCNQRTVEIQCE